MNALQFHVASVAVVGKTNLDRCNSSTVELRKVPYCKIAVLSSAEAETHS